MTKEEYLLKKQSVDEKITDLREEMRNIEREYIDSQLKIPIGSKVEITSSKKSEVGIVSSKRISYSGTPFYKLRKVKKDGSASRHELHIWGLDPNDSNTKIIE